MRSTFDADAVMEELQGFEDVMERVQNTLVKRLGSDVGISGLPGIFKDASVGSASASTLQGSDATAGAEKTKSTQSAQPVSGWRKRLKRKCKRGSGGQVPPARYLFGELQIDGRE